LNNTLLARYADSIFWLARYIERVENLARILDVNETFSRDSRGSQNWLSIVQLNTDSEFFFAKHKTAKAANVLDFYITDATNPTSIVSALSAARENARTLRPLISTEMWVHINIFYNRMRAIEATDLVSTNLSRLLGSIKQDCQTHTGITEGTFYRDQGWFFYQIGRYLERADQTTRLLDIKYHLLLPKPSDVGSAIDVSQWNALLRSAAGYHAFRRQNSSRITPGRVAGFLLLDSDFPRSVGRCIFEVSATLMQLKSRYNLRGGNDAAERLDELTSIMTSQPITQILANGLHEFIDMIQSQLTLVTAELGCAFFGYEREAAVTAAGPAEG
jgi:uncharacterized alpha-E superfamily protein